MRFTSVPLLGIAIAIVTASSLRGGDPVRPFAPFTSSTRSVTFVPWRLHRSDSPPASLTLYWMPASRDEVRRSELITSRELGVAAAQCVAMEVVRSDDEAMLAKLGVDGPLPLALLVDASGKTVARVEAVRGALAAAEVERVVLEELHRREAAAERALDEAKRTLAAGDRAAAAARYRSVAQERCASARQRRDAQHALRRLP